MARENRVRLSDEEIEKIDLAGKAWFGETAEELPRGRTIGEIAQHVINTHEEVLENMEEKQEH